MNDGRGDTRPRMTRVTAIPSPTAVTPLGTPQAGDSVPRVPCHPPAIPVGQPGLGPAPQELGTNGRVVALRRQHQGGLAVLGGRVG